jgi:hypothetical protein
VNRELADEAVASVDGSGTRLSAAERRVRGILEGSEAGQALKSHLFACARAVLGPWAQYLDPTHCENRALVIEPGGFISTHKDSRTNAFTLFDTRGRIMVQTAELGSAGLRVPFAA